MKITLNGERYETAAATVAELVQELGYGNQAVAIERNEQIVPKQAHGQTELAEGDRIELVTLVGGGRVTRNGSLKKPKQETTDAVDSGDGSGRPGAGHSD
jgi:thiamine biosynthesis protein ThiS